jgi:hypothetical protein
MPALPIGNGPLGTEGDSVAVVTPWVWPDALAGVTGSDFERVAAVIRAGKWREHPQSKNWVGLAVAQALDLDIENKTIKARVLRMIRAWLRSKSLVVVDGFDDKSMRRKFVEVAEDPA